MQENQYDTFSYERPADYIPLMKQRYGEIEEGFQNAEAMARINDRQRLANAENMGRAIDKAFKFSRTLGTYLEAEQEKRETKFRNTAANINLATGATLAKMTEWERNQDNIKGDYTYHQYLASEADKRGDTALAEQLRSMTGWQVRIQKEGLLKQAGINYETNLRRDINQQNPDGSWKYTVKRATTGEDIHWGIADIDEKRALIAQWEVDTGLTEVNFAKPEFLEKYYSPLRSRAVAKILAAENEQIKAANTAKRFQSYDDQLVVSTKSGTLGEKVHELLEMEQGNFENGRAGAGEAIKGRLLQLALQGKVEPGELVQLSEFKFEHRGYKEPVPLTVFKEFQNWGGEVAAIQEAVNKQRVAERKIAASAYVAKVKEGGKKQAYTEADKTAIIAGLKDAVPGLQENEIPPYIKNLLTVEKKEDQEYIAELEYKKSVSAPINPEDYMYINDAEEKKKWEDYANTAAGSGMPSSINKLRKRDVTAIVSTHLSQTQLQTEKDLDYNMLHDRATSLYNTLYGDLAENWAGSNADLHAEIIRRVRDKLPDLNVPLSAAKGDPNKFNRDLKAGEEDLINTLRANPNYNPSEILSNGLIKGSDVYYKELENYALNPGNGRIPKYYYKIAKRFPLLTAWDVANLQYRSQTGKELPKPYQIQKIQSYHPAVQRLFTHNPTYNRVNHQSKSGRDFSKNGKNEQYVQPGVLDD